MAVRYYDDLICAKLKKWVGENSNLRVLKPDETKRLFEVTADDGKDKAFKLPLIAVSRNNDIELIQNIKESRSYDGLTVYQDNDKTVQLNVIPIRFGYQIDIYTKTYNEGDEYLREFLFKLINNPKMVIEIPYHDSYIRHNCYWRVLNSVSDTSSISERIFSGQFTRWTIQLEMHDTFLFSVPYRKNWKLFIDDLEIVAPEYMNYLDAPEELPEEAIVEAQPMYIETPVENQEDKA